MAERKVQVEIAGRETVSTAAKSAEGALGSFASKAASWFKGLAAVAVGSALFGFFRSAITEAKNAEVGMVRLQTAVENAGGVFPLLESKLEAAVKSVMKMSTATDDELREALTRMITVSGDVEGSIQNLALVTDIAAFKNISLEEASLAVGKAMTGNVGALNRLGVAGKDATTVIENARVAFGGFAEEQSNTFGGSLKRLTNQWGEFKEAVGNALIGGNAMQSGTNTLIDTLVDLEEWVVVNQESIQGFVDAIVGAATSVIENGPKIINVFKDILTLGTWRLTQGAKDAGDALVDSTKLTEEQVLKLFEVHVARRTRELQRWQAAREHNARATVKTVTEAEDAATRVIELEGKARTKLTAKELEELQGLHLQMAANREKATREANALLEKTSELLKKQNVSQHAEQWAEVGRNVRRVKGDLSDTLPPADALKQSIEENKRFMEQNAEAAGKNREQIEESVESGIALARSFIDIAQATGIMDAKTASTLNSVLNMATAISRMGVDPAGGVIGIIGGLANLITSWGSSATEKERRAVMDKLAMAIRANTEALKIGTTGATMAGTSAAITAALPFAAQGTSRVAFFQELASRNISKEDFLALAEQMGFGDIFETKDEQAFAAALRAFQSKLASTPIKAGQTFGEQIGSIREIGELTGASETDILSQISDLAAGMSPALREALFGGAAGLGTGGLTTAEGRAAARQQLIDVLKSLAPGGAGIGQEQLGGLTPAELIEAIKSLLPLLASGNIDFGVDGSGGPLGGIPTGAPNTPPRRPDQTSPGVTGDPAVAPSLLGGDLATLLGGGSANLAALIGFGSTDAASLGAMTPLLSALKQGAGAGADSGHFEQSIGQYVAGDLNQITNVTPPVNVDPQEIAVIVRQLMADAYTNQSQALGQGR